MLRDPETEPVTGPLTTREIARRLGISHGRVQQIEHAALAKMAAMLRGEGLSTSLDVFDE